MNLTDLQHSPFLQSLGWAIANSLWQAAALWIAYHLVIGVYKNASAKFKNTLSTILLSAAFIWFSITLFNKYFAIESLLGYEIQYYDSNSIDAGASVNWEALIQYIAGILPYLSVAYLLLLVLLTARLINVYRFTRHIRFNGLQKPRAEWKLFTEKVARQMGITKKIRLWVSHHIDVPATIGFMKPVILIPLASVNQLSADQLEAIILHELSHIKRNDYLINLFVSIIETILFFNPFIVLLSRIIKRERENCCDDFVIQYQYDRHAYASALLSLEQFRNINLRLAIGATSGKKQLLVRVKRIMEVSGNTNFNYGQKLVALLLITGVICSVAWLSPQNNENKKVQVTKSKDKNNDKVIKKIEKANVLVLSQNDTKFNKPTQKPPLKKSFSKTEPEMNELRNLNLKELAALQYKRVNQLLQESKKEISRKKLPKFNINKLLFARGTTPHANMFTNGNAFSPVKVLSGTPALKQQYAFGFDIQKFQADWDKAHHSFSFDSEQMQNAVKQALNSKEVKRLLSLNHTIKQSDIEKMLTDELYSAAEKNFRTLLNQAPKVFSSAHSQSLYFADSVMSNENKLRHERTRKPFKERTNPNSGSTPVPDVRSSYTYGFGHDVATTEVKARNTAGGGRSSITEKPISYAGEHGYTYTVTTPANCPVIAPALRQKTATKEKESIRVEYKNGIILINDKEIRLADIDKVIARTSPRLKKISVVEQQLINERIND